MKKILCIIDSLGPGGAERQITYLATLLKKKNYQVELVYYIKRDFYLPFLVENKVKYTYLSNRRSCVGRFIALKKAINEICPDTIITYAAFPSMVGCVLKLLGANFKLIVSERNTTRELNLRERAKFFLYRWSDVIVPNSNTQGEFLKRYSHYLNDKIKVITNYVDSIYFSLKNAPSSHNQISILCIGKIKPQKNVLRFIDAIKIVKDSGYNIIINWYGHDLKDQYSQQCHSSIYEKQLSNVFFIHDASHNIIKEYHSADVFCLPSIYEGFPNVICEAMSCGLPIMCSNVCDNRYLVENGINGILFNPMSAESIARDIIKFIETMYGNRVKIGIENRNKIRKICSEDVFVRKYIEII